MASISGTSVQKTLKQETTTLFARASVGAAGAVTIVSTGGASKGTSITKTGGGQYTLTFDVGGIYQFLGSPVITIKNSNLGDNTLFIAKVVSENATAGTISFATFKCNLSGDSTVADPLSGSEIQVTVFMTPSPVF